MKSLLVGFLVMSCFLGGCATTPISILDAKQVPKERLFAFQTMDTNKLATLTVIRDEGYLGSACYYAFWINQKLVARVDVAEFANFYVEPGELLLRIGRDPEGAGLCGADQENWTQRETTMKPGDKKTFRMSIDVNGKLDIMRADPNQPKKQVYNAETGPAFP